MGAAPKLVSACLVCGATGRCAVMLNGDPKCYGEPIDTSAWSQVSHGRLADGSRVFEPTARRLDRIAATGGARKRQTPSVQRASNGKHTVVKVVADSFALTDLGNAERFVSLFGRLMRHCEAMGWLIWDGTRWKRDDIGEIYRLAMCAIRELQKNAAELDDDRRLKLMGWLIKSESRRAIEAMIHLAKAMPDIGISSDKLDGDPWLFNVANGTIDLQTGKLEKHGQDDLITKISPVAFDPQATCPTFAAFVQTIFTGNTELIAFVQRAAGYSMTGLTTERSLFMPYGTGANGKSTLLDVFRYILADYSMHARPDTILAKRGDSIPCDVARLAGSRFVSVTEIEDGRRMDIATVKEMTGGSDPITARFMRHNEFTFLPTFKLWVACNHRPVVRDQTESIWDRVKLIPFDVRIEEADRDPNLPAKLKAEAGGVLNWMLAGCREWQRIGLRAPEAVKAATAEYRAESDNFATWRDENTELDALATTQLGHLYANYRTWCESTGERPVTMKAFGTRMQAEDYERVESNYVSYRGLRLRDRALDH